MNRKMIWNDGLDSWTEEELLCMKYLNVCYGKGGGSAPPPPPSSVQQSTTAEFPTELRPFVSDIFEKSQAIQEQRQEEGYQPELTQQLASFTPEQEASFQGIQNVVGQTQPLFDEATTLARQSGRAATDPAEVAALMNPFLRNVTDIQKREAQRVGDVQEQQLAAQASQAGAFGGSRAAILEAERQRNLSQQLGDIEAQGLAASFQNAQNQLQNQFGRESAAAAQLGALGAAIPAQQFKEFGALSGIGAAKQQQAQRAFDIATQQAREEYGFPMATLQDFSSILRGFPLPATQNVSRQSFSPAQPLSTQLLGLGTGLAGLAGAAGAFKKAGGLVGAPVGMKNGGYVKLAGGGGLGQMMQEKLPSNRVRMGKTAYQDASSLTLEEFIMQNMPTTSAEARAFREHISAILMSKVTSREGEAPDMDEAQRLLKQPVANTLAPSFIEESIQTTRSLASDPTAPADIATTAIQTAGGAGIPTIPVAAPSVFKNPNNLSFLQKAFSVADDIAQGMPTGSPVEIALGQSAPDIPAPALVSAPPVSASVEVPLASRSEQLQAFRDSRRYKEPATVPASFLQPATEEIVTSPAGPSISGLNPVTGAAPEAGLLQRGQQNYPLKRDVPISKYAPPPPSPIPSSELRSNAPFGRGDPAEGYTDKGLKALEKYNVPFERRGVRPELGDKPVQTEKLGFSPKTRENVRSFIGGTSQGRNPFQRLANTIGLDTGLTNVAEIYDIGGRAIGSLGGIGEHLRTPDFSSIADPDVLAEQVKTKAAEEKKQKFIEDIDQSVKGGEQVKKENIFDTEGPQPAAAAAPKAAPTSTAPADLDANNIDMDIQLNPDLSSSQGMTQNSYSKFLKDFREGQNKDYSAEVEKAMGPAPTYEKGEEPDFAARKWLALANFGAGILASGGGKTLAQSIGEAAKPALKELADIGKEERKIKRELRTERNAQKRMKYQDKLQRFDLQRKLRSDDLDSIKALANIKHQEKIGKISEYNANTQRGRFLNEKALKEFTLLEGKLSRQMTDKGLFYIKDVMSELQSLSTSMAKTAVQNAQFGITSTMATKAYKSQLPAIYERYRGKVIRDGNVLSDKELLAVINPPTAGETTLGTVKGAIVKRGKAD